MLSPKYVDTREAPERRIPLERAGFGLRALPTGDVQFPESGGATVLLENKKVGQLLEDMATGQLVRQCQRMVETSPYSTLMVEGHWRQANGVLLERRYSWEAAWNQLQTVQDLGVRVQLTTGPEHTVTRILELAEYYGKGVHESALRHPSGDKRLAALSLIFGVGTKLGRQLLAHFGSLGAIARATPEELEAVEGIGPKVSMRVAAFWAEERPILYPK